MIAAFPPLAAEGLVGLSAPVAFELGYAARNSGDFQALSHRLSSFLPVPTTDADHRKALDVQASLAERSKHRALSLVDALAAAAAEARGFVVLHDAAGCELVADITGQRHERVVVRGTAD